MTQPQPLPVKVQFFAPDPAIARYVPVLNFNDIRVGDGETIVDYLHPEWGNIRFIRGEMPLVSLGNRPAHRAPGFVIAGPTSMAHRIASGSMQSWGIGLLPLGWVKLFGGSAQDYADRVCCGFDDPVFAKLRPLAEALLSGPPACPDAEAARINRVLVDLFAAAPADDDMVAKAHEILLDPALCSVAKWAERLGVSERSVERLSRRAFGFPPKLLLRRQRFLRTLAQAMLDPKLRYIDTLDERYYDQAHFARDFRRFMGMTPSAYRKMPKPMLGAAVFGRMQAAGAAMQVLHDPR